VINCRRIESFAAIYRGWSTSFTVLLLLESPAT
jgi:hypothetical protein